MITRIITKRQMIYGLGGAALGLIFLSLFSRAPVHQNRDIEPAGVAAPLPVATPGGAVQAMAGLPVATTAAVTGLEPIEAKLEVSAGAAPAQPPGLQASVTIVPEPTVSPTFTLPNQQLQLPPPVNLPQADVNELLAIAEAEGITNANLARENSIVYALPDGPAVFLLTPVSESPGFSSKELSHDPAAFARRMLGGLTIKGRINDQLPDPNLTDSHYVLTLSDDGTRVAFIGRNSRVEFPADILAFTRPVIQPFAVIGAEHLCLAWDATQICARVRSPLPDNFVQELQAAAGSLPPVGNFDFNLSMPDLGNRAALRECDSALNVIIGESSPFGCQAELLTAPAVGGMALPPGFQIIPPPDQVMGAGLFVFDQLQTEEVYSDPKLTNPVETLPAGAYLVYVVRYAEDQPVVLDLNNDNDPETQVATLTRLLVFRPGDQAYYLTFFSDVQVIGEVNLTGGGPDAGVAWFIRRVGCLFNECGPQRGRRGGR